MSNKTLVKITGWGSALIGTALSLYVWGASLSWKVSNVTAYSLFPVLGLVVYSLMISHYLTSTIRVMSDQPRAIVKNYLTITSTIVLICILLHPTILIYKLWSAGHGLPPASYTSYVASSMVLWVYVGTLSWVAFLLYELRRKYVTQPWWKYIQYASDIAMIGIFFHGLKLGQHLGSGWFQAVWYIYGFILLASLSYSYGLKKKS